jgi:hypothetical protein
LAAITSPVYSYSIAFFVKWLFYQKNVFSVNRHDKKNKKFFHFSANHKKTLFFAHILSLNDIIVRLFATLAE